MTAREIDHPLLQKLASNPRCRLRNDAPIAGDGRCVVYWMQRAQRGADNPALDAAIWLGNELSLPVAVFFAPVPFFPSGNTRHYTFLFEGHDDLRDAIEARGAAFVFRTRPRHRIDAFAAEVKAAIVIGDENPLRETERWRQVAAQRLKVALVTVDADVIVPTALFPKEEHAAYTLRPKIQALLPEYLAARREPNAKRAFAAAERPASDPFDAQRLLAKFGVKQVAPVSPYFRGGSRHAEERLAHFVNSILRDYPEARNKPELDGTSRLSPWLHFGHIGPRRVALAVFDSEGHDEAKKAFLEQLIVRRELAINFVSRNPNYDSFESAVGWAKDTLDARRQDARPYSLSREQIVFGRTPDPLWNAAQNQMRITGYMHNHMRMYWAKKLLEWSASPEEAWALAVELNDEYELDGRDPNGYTGVAWSMGGKHDRPFAPGRNVFGTIRPMTLASTGRKFDSKRYIAEMSALASEVDGS